MVKTPENQEICFTTEKQFKFWQTMFKCSFCVLLILLLLYITPLCFSKCKLGERAVGFERKKVTKIMMNYLLQRWKTVVESQKRKKTSFVVMISQHIVLSKLLYKAEQNRCQKNKNNMFSFFVVVVYGFKFFLFLKQNMYVSTAQ